MSPLLESGVELMLVGMGTVFVFLTLLVFATSAMSSLILRFFPAMAVPDLASSTAREGPTEEEVAAISIALATHLNQQQPDHGRDRT